MEKVINIGVLGAANIAQKYIFDTIHNLNGYFKFTAVASRDTQKLKYFKKYNVACFNDYLDFVKSAEIDAVYIPLPNSLHYYWSKKCQKMGST